MPNFDLSRAMLEQHSVDLRQFIDWRQATLTNGLRVVDGYNASGLTLTLLPDRGLDIGLAAYNGRPLTWISQGSPHAADFGGGWLRLFNGGLLVTCGLRHVGPPEKDTQSGQFRDLHGDFSLLRAYNLAVRSGWQGQQYVSEVSGEVAEGALFDQQLHLARTVRMVLGEPAVEVIDVVENRYDTPAPLMVRYRCAVPRHQEEVFFHQICANAQGEAQVVLSSEEFGVALSWDAAAAPYLTQWKNYRKGTYVCGIEPGNCVPEGQNRARRSGRLQQLAPGERRTFRSRLVVLENAAAVAAALGEIDRQRDQGEPVSIVLDHLCAQQAEDRSGFFKPACHNEQLRAQTQLFPADADRRTRVGIIYGIAVQGIKVAADISHRPGCRQTLNFWLFQQTGQHQGRIVQCADSHQGQVEEVVQPAHLLDAGRVQQKLGKLSV